MARRRKGIAIHGWVALDKPLNMTSTEAVSRVRRLFNAQKAGHAGTLDPLATGLLPIALGEATKTVPFVVDARKAYAFTVHWGVATDSCDREGAVMARSDVRPDEAAIRAALPDFIGEITQVPPVFSAIRIDGARAYDLARAGEAVDIPARQVLVHDLTLVQAGPDQAQFVMTCGKGTYVRALGRDLAERLGTVGHISALRRTRTGAFTEKESLTLEKLEDLGHKGALHTALLAVETALDDIPALALTREEVSRLRQGRSIVVLPKPMLDLQQRLVGRGDDPVVLATYRGQAAALVTVRAGQLCPVRVFQMNGETDVDHNRA